MAITTEISNNMSPENLPSGYTKPTVTITFTTYNSAKFEATIAASGNTHASNQATGLTQILAAFKTWLDSTFVGTNLGLNSSDTINGIAYVYGVKRENSAYSSTTGAGNDIYITGTDQFRINFEFRWEKTA